MKKSVYILFIFLFFISCKKEPTEFEDEPYLIDRYFQIYITDTTSGQNAFLPGSKYYLYHRDTSKLIRLYDSGSPSYDKLTLDSANNMCFTSSIFSEYTYTKPEIAYKNVRFNFKWVIYINASITDTLDVVKEDEANVHFYLSKKLIKTGNIQDYKYVLELKK